LVNNLRVCSGSDFLSVSMKTASPVRRAFQELARSEPFVSVW
jgi:hypothetical protein